MYMGVLGGLLIFFMAGCSQGHSPIPNVGAPMQCSALTRKGPLDSTENITVGGLSRTYQLHLPASYNPARPTPVVINLHGLTGDGPGINAIGGMISKSDAEGFIVVAPNGVQSSWNAGTCCG